MRVFVTGATGFVGAAVVEDLITAGHEVLGLARSDVSAVSLAAAGAGVHRGSIEDLESVRSGAAMADGVIHTAFDNSDFTKIAQSSEAERLALEAIGKVFEGSSRPLIVTAGLTSLAPGRVVTEDDVRRPDSGPTLRVSEQTAAELAKRGVHASVVRLPCVHGLGDRFTIPMFVDVARRTGFSAYIDDGTNRWSAVHNKDAAEVYRLALEAGVRGARYHAVSEEGIPFRAIAEVLGRQLGLPVVSVPQQEAGEHFGMLSVFAQADIPASSELTRERLGWRSNGPHLLVDIDRPEYHGSCAARV
jgi:nucleoside-diphosphate-sugar epimerase